MFRKVCKTDKLFRILLENAEKEPKWQVGNSAVQNNNIRSVGFDKVRVPTLISRDLINRCPFSSYVCVVNKIHADFLKSNTFIICNNIIKGFGRQAFDIYSHLTNTRWTYNLIWKQRHYPYYAISNSRQWKLQVKSQIKQKHFDILKIKICKENYV